MSLPPAVKTVQSDLLAGLDSHSTEMRPIYVELIRALQRATTPAQFFDVHRGLLETFLARQQVVRERRRRADAEQRDLASFIQEHKAGLVAREATILEHVGGMQERVKILRQLDERDSVLQHVVRCMADGLAWRALGFDRAAISVLAEGERVGYLSEGRGFEAEVGHLVGYWEEFGAVALLHDLTNCLRNGDLTVLRGDWPRFSVGFREVKAGGARRRSARQDARLDERIRVLRTGSGQTNDETPYRLHRLPIPYRTHMAALRDVVSQARDSGLASVRPEDGVVVSAANLLCDDRVDELGGWYNRAAEAEGWTPADDRHFQESSFVRRFWTHRRPGNHGGYIAPVAIFPLPAEDIVDILLGRIEYSVTLRAEALEARFAARGMHARCAGRDEWDGCFLVAKRGRNTVVVPPDVRRQMLLELMTSDTLVDIVEFTLDALDAGALVHEEHVLCCDEFSVWAASS